MDKNYEMIALAEKCQKHKLFVDGWVLEGVYDEIVNGSDEYLIEVFFDGQVPVAVATIHLPFLFVNVFVVKEYRGGGLAKRVLNNVLMAANLGVRQVCAAIGDEGSVSFYNKLGILVIHNHFSLSINEVRDMERGNKSLMEIIGGRIKSSWESLGIDA